MLESNHNSDMVRRLFSFCFFVVLWTGSWKLFQMPFGASKGPLGSVWGASWRGLGSFLEASGGLVGTSWGHLGRYVA